MVPRPLARAMKSRPCADVIHPCKEIPNGAFIGPVGNIGRLRVALLPVFQNEECNSGA